MAEKPVLGCIVCGNETYYDPIRLELQLYRGDKEEGDTVPVCYKCIPPDVAKMIVTKAIAKDFSEEVKVLAGKFLSKEDLMSIIKSLEKP